MDTDEIEYLKQQLNFAQQQLLNTQSALKARSDLVKIAADALTLRGDRARRRAYKYLMMSVFVHADESTLENELIKARHEGLTKLYDLLGPNYEVFEPQDALRVWGNDISRKAIIEILMKLAYIADESGITGKQITDVAMAL